MGPVRGRRPSAPWVQRLGQVQAVVNLAGENVGGHGPLPRRWTEAHKTRLRASRLQATRALVEGLAVTPAERRPQVLLNASAIGYYGDRGDEVLTEASAPGNDFFANLCLDWEVATLAAEDLGLRVVQLRTGVVLAPGAMASDLLVLASRLGAGGPLGSGRQWWSWIHRDDVIGLTQFALHTDAISGAINLVAPNPRQMRDFPAVLGRLLHRPSLLRTPAWALRLAFGELADQLLLASQRVLPARARRLATRSATHTSKRRLRPCCTRHAPSTSLPPMSSQTAGRPRRKSRSLKEFPRCSPLLRFPLVTRCHACCLRSRSWPVWWSRYPIAPTPRPCPATSSTRPSRPARSPRWRPRLEAAGLVDTLKGAGPFTVFAPTDAAFAPSYPRAPSKACWPIRISSAPCSPTTSCPGKVTAADVMLLPGAKTVQGEELAIGASDRTACASTTPT